MDDHRRSGVTLLELLVTVSLVGLLVSLGVPTLQHSLQGARLRAAAETIRDDLQRARARAIRLNRPLYLSFSRHSPHDWCYGLSDRPGCDCRLTRGGRACGLTDDAPAAARLRRTSAAYPRIALHRAGFGATTQARFSPLRGTARAGRVVLAAPDRRRLQVLVSSLGRVRICAQGFAGYPPC